VQRVHSGGSSTRQRRALAVRGGFRGLDVDELRALRILRSKNSAPLCWAARARAP
jgi:hypothetical protein